MNADFMAELRESIEGHPFLSIDDESSSANFFAVFDSRGGDTLGVAIGSHASLAYLIAGGAKAWLESGYNGVQARKIVPYKNSLAGQLETMSELIPNHFSGGCLTAVAVWLRQKLDVTVPAGDDQKAVHAEVRKFADFIGGLIPTDVQQEYIDELCL